MSEPQQPSKARGCLKYSCLGCLIVVGVPAVVLTVVLLIGLTMGVPEPVRVNHETTQDLPVISPAELPQVGELTTEIQQVPLGRGRIELDVSMARLDIVRGEPGESLRLEANYDSASFELDEDFFESGDVWTYKLHFDTRLGWFRSIFKRNPGRNTLRLVVPEGVPISVTGGIAVGESNLDLGGLWVSEVDVAYGPGSTGQPQLFP